ncbi:MAG TPA: DUF951 domain-containing protein [Bacillota bacterium]|nr:DUF951 domain-containing protein [Bacillota bacterium]
MYSPGDIVELKKPHPCGANKWKIIRIGMDFRFQCCNCGRSVLLPRKQAEKAIRKVLSC